MSIETLQAVSEITSVANSNFIDQDISSSFSNKTSEINKSLFAEKILSVDEQLKAADSLAERYIRGEDVPVHDVMISMGKAKTELQLLVEVRNKLLEAYQEVTRIQI